MPKPTRKEILEAMNDPELLKEAGLQPISDKEEEELFSDIVVGGNDDISDVVKKINDRSRKQKDYLRKREEKILKAAEEKAKEPEKNRKDKEIDSFLKEHPELSNNKELLDVVSPLYNNGMSLEDAWKKGCKSLDLDVTTGLAPKKEDDKKKDDGGDKRKATEKKTALKTDSSDDGLADAGLPKGKEDTDKPKSLREIISEQANDLAATGKNPWRDTP